ncbi:MAG: hypothetical protein AVDCRST_MAG19-2243 [uncultured Thermomicrobiales bacterium]|uniref:Uncharacterized protein n=1 Tax=uncultured Thermomicrobiales bacterium TaxID=1645740 RepID=A0A6J4V5E7_9BACT|nr:MAG: hypothetical protein AVDCRST_MAG19-2243 [uncultured Thermomicrobiales bacterium]
MLRARGRPQSQEPMVGVRERPPAANGDEAGVAVFGEDHGAVTIVCDLIKPAPDLYIGLGRMRDALPEVGPGPVMGTGGDGQSARAGRAR